MNATAIFYNFKINPYLSIDWTISRPFWTIFYPFSSPLHAKWNWTSTKPSMWRSLIIPATLDTKNFIRSRTLLWSPFPLFSLRSRDELMFSFNNVRTVTKQLGGHQNYRIDTNLSYLVCFITNPLLLPSSLWQGRHRDYEFDIILGIFKYFISHDSDSSTTSQKPQN